MNLIADYWKAFQESHPEYANVDQPPSYYYCDNKKDADECAELFIRVIQ